MQEEGHGGLMMMADKPVKLRAMGQGRKSALQVLFGIAVEVPFALKLPKLVIETYKKTSYFRSREMN